MSDPTDRRRLPRWLRVLATVFVLLMAFVGAPLLYIEGSCRAPLADVAARSPGSAPGLALASINAPDYKRSEARTYLAFAAWYTVYSFDDFARFVARNDESAFPYASHIAGFWKSFCAINRLTVQRGEPVGGAKAMIYTIGVGYSVELAVKGLYENSVGRVTEWWRGPQLTVEDKFARSVAKHYARFLYAFPWYRYPFGQRLQQLWEHTWPQIGGDMVRSLERKLALSAEYGAKSVYGWVIGQVLVAAGTPAKGDIMLVVDALPSGLLSRARNIEVVWPLEGDKQLIRVPRYPAFTVIVRGLARANQRVHEIAGNDEILMTVVLRKDDKPVIAGAVELFSMPLNGRPGFRRAGVKVEVARLTGIIRKLEQSGATIEQLYDY
ncbi:MAG: hypothetical protein ACR2PO_08190 [Methyloligellaceae bacterium]